MGIKTAYKGYKSYQYLEPGYDYKPFDLVKEIRIQTNRDGLIRKQTIRIYRYLDPKPITADYIEIRLPAVGQTIKGSIRHLKSNPIVP